MSRILYADAQTFMEYASDRGVFLTEQQAKIEIAKAQDYIDTAYSYKGERVFDDSAFPRYGLDNYASDVVPKPIQLATMRVALMSFNGANLYASNAESIVKKEVIATNRIETEYAVDQTSVAFQQPILVSDITRMLDEAGLLASIVGIGGRLYGVRG